MLSPRFATLTLIVGVHKHYNIDNIVDKCHNPKLGSSCNLGKDLSKDEGMIN